MMRFAYADPPYPGQARRHYQRDEVDHQELVQRLIREFPDGWALSTSSTALRRILILCPEDVRIMAWVKPFAIFKPNVNPAYAWEPLVVRGGRRYTRAQKTVRDWVSANITLRRGLVGVKPAAFSFWLFSILNVLPGDDFIDLYPGSGAITKALAEYLDTLATPATAI